MPYSSLQFLSQHIHCANNHLVRLGLKLVLNATFSSTAKSDMFSEPMPTLHTKQHCMTPYDRHHDITHSLLRALLLWLFFGFWLWQKLKKAPK
jgi:hypothetical protein